MTDLIKSGNNAIQIPGPLGPIEANFLVPERFASEELVALVCHPHPLHGGAMTNKVTHTLAKGFVELGIPALRFNFRGVGQSPGEFDHGIGEGDDVAACIDWLTEQLPDFQIILAGFSFGAFVSLKHWQRFSLAAMVSVAPPIARFEFAGCTQPSVPWQVIMGSEDELVALDDVYTWLRGLGAESKLSVIDGASHFFHGRLLDLRAMLFAFMDSSFGLRPDGD